VRPVTRGEYARAKPFMTAARAGGSPAGNCLPVGGPQDQGSASVEQMFE
jgi:hypothetical protein